VKEAQQLGMKVNVWTVNKVENIQKFIDMKVDYITTDQPLETKELLR
jgi:glycerophosphoryl diester phosphodiesterase